VTDTSDDARALARDLAHALDHLRTIWEVEYVPAGSVGVAAPVPVQADAGGAQPQPQPRVAKNPDSKVALRQQAETWSAATKLEYLRRKNLGDCQRCGLCRTRTNIVFGVGNPEADLMFVGEAPGADEDRQGEPFVGRAGQRLDVWIRDLGLRREDVYIANVLKCRPPGNRDPKPEEVDKCSPFLKAQIRAISPKVIVALGRHAGMLLSRRDDMTLRAMRNTRLTYDASGKNDPPGSRAIPLVVTYHPAYVLRQEGNADRPAAATDAVMSDLHRALQVAKREE
jgi:DNA polymerase